MSRLTDLIAKAKAKDADLGRELEREFNVLKARRSFGIWQRRMRMQKTKRRR